LKALSYWDLQSTSQISGRVLIVNNGRILNDVDGGAG
jgi:hypothetical protein